LEHCLHALQVIRRLLLVAGAKRFDVLSPGQRFHFLVSQAPALDTRGSGDILDGCNASKDTQAIRRSGDQAQG
jgi:hypothetical protein